MSTIIRGTITEPFLFLMVSSADHLTGRTQNDIGAKPTVHFSKNGGAPYAVPAAQIAEVGAATMPGLFKVTPIATDVDTLGPLALHASGTGCDPVDREYRVVDSAATQVLVTPGNKLATNPAGAVDVNSFDADAQVTIATKAGEGVLVTPDQKLATDASGFVTATNGGGGGGATPSDFLDALKGDVEWDRVHAQAGLNFAVQYPPAFPGNGSVTFYAGEVGNSVVVAAFTMSYDTNGRVIQRVRTT